MQKCGYRASMTILEPLPTRNSPPGPSRASCSANPQVITLERRGSCLDFSKPASDHAIGSESLLLTQGVPVVLLGRRRREP
jgi:hypothetical protein